MRLKICVAYYLIGLFMLTPLILKSQSTDSLIYENSIRDAINPELAEIQDLISITKDNEFLSWESIDSEEYVLMVNLISTNKYHQDSVGKYYNTGGYDTWVTAHPEVLNRLSQDTVRAESDSIRIRQLYGFPPNKKCNYAIEFWVKPQDLFRPCPDLEINDSHCDLCFPVNTPIEHADWFNENRLKSYYKSDLYDQYPWTQLGYTYDWNPKTSEVGLSEFVIRKNSLVFIKEIYRLDEYLRLNNKQ
jgi:hypothetical protein